MTHTTPSSISLLRKDNYVLTFEKDGYEQKKAEVQRKMQGGILFLDIFFTGLLGVVVDGITGDWYKLSPDNINVTLTKKEGASSELPETIDIKLSMGKTSGPLQDLQINSDESGVVVRVEKRSK